MAHLFAYQAWHLHKHRRSLRILPTVALTLRLIACIHAVHDRLYDVLLCERCSHVSVYAARQKILAVVLLPHLLPLHDHHLGVASLCGA